MQSASASSTPRFPRAVLYSLLAACLGILLLELWRPFYFLGDDNLSSTYPVFLEASRRLWTGHSPVTNPFIFGGRNDWLHDPAGLCLWNPILLLISPIAFTPFRLAMMDLYAATHILIGAGAFAALLVRLRTKEDAEISDRRIVFLTASYIFSIWTIVVTPNWVTFLANQASLPIIFLGFYAETRRRGVLLIALGVGYGLLAGHPNSFMLCLVFLAIFLLCHDAAKHDWEWTRRAALGHLIVFIGASPLLAMAYQGFSQTSRSTGLTTEFLTKFAYPAPLLPASYFFGAYSGLLVLVMPVVKVGFATIGQSVGMACAFGGWCVFWSLGARRRWSVFERACMITVAVVALFVIRPMWLALVLQHLPALRSTRIAFREIFALLFFIHLWIASRPVTVKGPRRLLFPAIGMAVFLTSLSMDPPPFFTPFPLDRRLIFNGEGDAYWTQIRQRIGPDGRFVPVLNMNIEQKDFPRIPWYLLAGYNYPSMLRVHSETGYVIRGMRGSYLHGIASRSPVGTFDVKDIPKLRAADPSLNFLVLTSFDPVKIELRDSQGTHPLAIPHLPALNKDLNQIVGP